MHKASLVGVVVVVVAVLGPSRNADARGGAMLVPPLRLEAGTIFPIVGGDAVEPGTELLIGAHWSAITWRPTRFDIGIGYIGSKRPLLRGLRSSIERATQPRPIDDTFSLNGAYLSFGRTLVNQKHFRTWIEARGELLKSSVDARPFSVVGGAVRFAAEIFSSGVGGHSDHNSLALFAGTVSVGVYVEASHRDIPLELGPTGLAGGISIRIPFLLAVAG